MSEIQLVKGTDASKAKLVKADGKTSVQKAVIGVDWDKKEFVNDPNIDIDLLIVATDDNGKVDNSKPNAEQMVYWGTKNAADQHPWCEFSGDNLTGDDNDSAGREWGGRHFDEQAVIDFNKLPAYATQVWVGVTIYDATTRGQKFGMMEKVNFTTGDFEDPSVDVVTIDLSKDSNFETATGALIAKYAKKNDIWTIEAVTQTFEGEPIVTYAALGIS